MEDILECCCGLDIHKESIVACLLKGPLEEGLKPRSEIKEFGTQLTDLMALRRRLEGQECHHVAMESTGIFWHPIYAVLEDALSDEMHLLVVNARHMKNVPGKKTVMRDAKWIATLLRAGLLKGSFVPEQDIRDLRQLTRYRKALIRDITPRKTGSKNCCNQMDFVCHHSCPVSLAVLEQPLCDSWYKLVLFQVKAWVVV